MSASQEQFGQLAERIIAETLAQFPLSRPIHVQWRAYRTTAGMADYQTNTILLSKQLMTDEQRLRSTILHEFAHLLAFDRAGRHGRGHGPAWQKAMQDLGEVPTVRHNYECQRNTKRQSVRYECLKCGCIVTRSRRLPKRRIYLHAGCGGRIRYVGTEARTT